MDPGVLEAAKTDPEVAAALKQAALDADGTVRELFEFRNYGVPLRANWTTQRVGAKFGTDYLMRTAVGRSNIFVNIPNETTYFYLDLDAAGDRLNGTNTYTAHFAADEIPPVQGFWSLTVYDKHHFVHRVADAAAGVPPGKNRGGDRAGIEWIRLADHTIGLSAHPRGLHPRRCSQSQTSQSKTHRHHT